MTDLTWLSAGELVEQYRTKEISPVEVTEAVLAKIERLEPSLHALYAADHARALDAARASERRWHAGQPGTLDGIPLTLKENIATEGTPIPLGTAATDLVPADADGPAAARSREEGGVLLAKTTMPDYGMLTSGLSSFHLASRNPWETSRTPGGSSAGAGAAAAAGYGPLHVGTDIGGSIRLPAGWCGLVGLKPSFGRVPVDPPYLGRAVGPMTRTVADAALYMSVLARPDKRDHLSLPPERITWDPRPLEPATVRIGLQLDAGVGLAVEPEIRAAVAAVASKLEQAGAIVEPVAPFLTREMLDGLDRFWRVRFGVDFAALPAERKAKILPYIAEWVAGGDGTSGTDAYRGFAQIDAMSVAAIRATEPYDFVLSPTCPVSAPAAESASPTDDPRLPFEHIGFTVPYNMSGQPAVSVNCGYTSAGMPVGLQIAGARFADLAVLRMAATIEQLSQPGRRPALVE
ncbi:aspartyl-tRNA(Asn)/glutamyl-tRNA(Gln) amidotransferase subunit A [Tamaricihabitans halophyticus]|uniref:Aspartyl-tRNA(Asn)/glutamyl-tRNA(Gln) amidotransferase subunit A n=1 Tax=Tamaricihabitans halophyticus TaxID=1262583 RepID=A0A4R2QMU1_9PSEU|nr:amidase [Tamaricihabitans halophyticus]TCP50892.1 aspartyl-tRNA(Asn)/glutamyl-tRNA(Gln) amidotransferase subunit A [Tamaricihabitans halophyticus]